MATGAAATGGRRACRPGHRCVGLDANAAGSVSPAAGRRALAGRGRRRASDATTSRQTSTRRCRRSRRRRRQQPFHASSRCALREVAARVDGGRQGGRIGARAPDEERPRAPRIPWSGFGGAARGRGCAPRPGSPGGRHCRPQAYDDAGGDHRGRVRPRPLLRDPRGLRCFQQRQGRGANCFDTDEADHSGGFDPDTDREGHQRSRATRSCLRRKRPPRRSRQATRARR